MANRKKNFFRTVGAATLLIAFGLAFAACRQPGTENPGEDPGTPGEGLGKLQEVADLIANSTGNEVTVKLSSAITVEDIEGEWDDPDAPGATIYDGLGNLYKALGTSKKIHLDLSEVEWKVEDDSGNMVRGIPGASNEIIHTNMRVGNPIASIIFPRDMVIIEGYAFSNAKNLKKIDFKGQSSLKFIGEGAFRNDASIEEMDFSGCTALTTIAIRAFEGIEKLEMLDLSQTSIDTLQSRSLQAMAGLKYIEFPATLRVIEDYAVTRAYSLKYVRFRNVNPHVSLFGWSCFNYSFLADGSPFNSLPVNNLVEIVENETFTGGTIKTWLAFHPNTIEWTVMSQGHWNYQSFPRMDYLKARNAPLPYSENPGNVYTPDVDKLRGQALLDYFGGKKSVKVEAEGLDAKYNGKTVISNIGSVPGTISGGKVNMTIGEPKAGELKLLNETTAQEITGLYKGGMFYNSPQSGDDWTVGGVSSAHGLPQVWPRNTNFAILELKVDNEYLTRYGKSSYSVWDWAGRYQDLRVMRYVYVDRDTSIFRMYRPDMGGSMHYVFLDLKEGWNQIEVIELGFVDPDPAKGFSMIDVDVWQSGGIMVDDDGGIPSLNFAQGFADKTLKEKVIPWTVRPEDTWKAILSSDKETTADSPHRN